MISEAAILITGLILFSGTVTYDLYNKSEIAKNANPANSTVQVEKGFFDQDKRK